MQSLTAEHIVCGDDVDLLLLKLCVTSLLIKTQQPIQTLRLLTGIALLLCLYLFRLFWEDTLVHK